MIRTANQPIPRPAEAVAIPTQASMATRSRPFRRFYERADSCRSTGGLPVLRPHHHAMDGQRRVRPCQQRRLLLVLRHGREPATGRERCARCPTQPDHRLRGRDAMPVLQADHVPRRHRCRDKSRPHRQEQRPLRDRDLPQRRRDSGRARILRHVYADRVSNRPVPALPQALREVLRPLLVEG